MSYIISINRPHFSFCIFFADSHYITVHAFWKVREFQKGQESQGKSCKNKSLGKMLAIL